MKINHIDHLVVTASDWEKSLRFYVDVLGMTPDESNNRIALKFGNEKINLHRKKGEFQPAARNICYGSLDICLIADGNIETILAELQAKGVEIEAGIVKRTGAMGPISSIYLRDPDGNLIEISTYD